jgi:hypothetical protein
MTFVDQNFIVRLRAGGTRMTVRMQDPRSTLLGERFVFCERLVKGKPEYGYFRRDQLIIIQRSNT